MSKKIAWGAGFVFFLTIAAQLIPLDEAWRWRLGISSVVLAVLCAIAWFVSKDNPNRSPSNPQNIRESPITGSNVATAGRDVHQTIYQGHDPSDKKKEIADKLGEFLRKGEHWKALCSNPTLQIFPGDRIKEWADDLESYVGSQLGQSYEARLASSTGITSFPVGVPENLRSSWRYINVRCVRLHEFIKELT